MESKNNNQDIVLTKEDLFECTSLIHSKIHELDSSLESLKITIRTLESTRYKEDKTLKIAEELYETQQEECERYSKLYKKIVDLYLIER